MNLPVTFKINGKVYTEMQAEERARQLDGLEKKRNEVNAYLKNLDVESEEALVEVLARCMDSFEFWCDHFCYTFDPRDMRDPHKHFILYEFQRRAIPDILAAIREGRDVHEDKSRDMGASWLMMALFTYLWLFDESFHALIGSRKEDLVDDWTIDSLFGKIDYILERLPLWMLGSYNRTKNRHALKIENPRTGSLITGESSNKNFGRGPRKNVVYLDEFAFWEDDYAVWTGIADTAPCKIYTSTPQGEWNQFAKIRASKDPNLLLLTFHWTDHPGKDLSWYEKEKEKRRFDTVAIAQELDCDYKASAGGLALPMLQGIKRLVVIPPATLYDPITQHSKFYASLDYGSSNPSAFHVHRVQYHPHGKARIQTIFEYYEPSSVKRLSEVIKECPYFSLIESIYADPSVWYYNQNTKTEVTSIAYLFRDLFQIYLTPGVRGDTYALEQLRIMWSNPDDLGYHITADCPAILAELEKLRYVTQSAFMERKRNKPETLVDKDNHAWDGFKYFFNSRFRIPPQPETEKPVPTGYEALNIDIQNVRADKLAALIKKPVQRVLITRRF